MANLSLILISLIFLSCSSKENWRSGADESSGYQHGRQLDERSLKAGFLEK